MRLGKAILSESLNLPADGVCKFGLVAVFCHSQSQPGFEFFETALAPPRSHGPSQLVCIIRREIRGDHGMLHHLFLENRHAQRAAQGLHLVFHLARAGWLRWKEVQPDAPARPGKGPLALRVRLDDGSGFDLTEAGTQRKLAVYVVADPMAIPMVATLGPDPLNPSFDLE